MHLIQRLIFHFLPKMIAWLKAEAVVVYKWITTMSKYDSSSFSWFSRIRIEAPSTKKSGYLITVHIQVSYLTKIIHWKHKFRLFLSLILEILWWLIDLLFNHLSKCKYCDRAWQKYANKHLQEKAKATKNISNNISFKVFCIIRSVWYMQKS